MQIRANSVWKGTTLLSNMEEALRHWGILVRTWAEGGLLEELSTLPTRYYNPPTLPVFPFFRDRRWLVKSVLISNGGHSSDLLRNL